ncbi:hypothetical protein O6H91_12G071300 [Diphasiastrum complanatum]|uniref:Uncharacterized protein n=3 Tax=Diphasiastrum complanatum TaxID=34168 RepID=A0ACC2C3L7_DIPCM|nr:hypothetical protein O6H91_12G071300 [Diphasiastrum complanatum]KAJ7536483.1 hypothetical protein O6H91_12G071300 [Diphasiastrum complanatum]KAJ7536486.1 hypothetical protein O6H91_12G071300 [Diphasiastrum complanatum]
MRAAAAWSIGNGRLASSSSSSSSCCFSPRTFTHLRLPSSFRFRVCRAFDSRSIPQDEQNHPSSQAAAMDVVTTYHDETKHGLQSYARGPHGLDWANQPNPFRRYVGARVVPLDHLPPSPPAEGLDPLYPAVFLEPQHPNPLTMASLSQFFYDSLALSAWKTAGRSTWSLRINPSSGNLHPTEGYVISAPLPGISESPFVAHYAPKEHALEVRAELPLNWWEELTQGLPEGSFLVGLTSIFWREAWKYGERAFRYCNHDVGHAIGAVSVAAAALGWECRLIDDLGTKELEIILGVSEKKPVSTNGTSKGHFPELEQEHADCLILLFPRQVPAEPKDDSGSSISEGQNESSQKVFLSDPLHSSTLISRLVGLEWKGKPNALSKEHVRWGIIYKVAEAARKPLTTKGAFPNLDHLQIDNSHQALSVYESLTARQVVHKRRSAVEMDGKYGMRKEVFYQILLKAMPSVDTKESLGGELQIPFRTLPWKAELHMALFVHTVVDLPKGIYFLVRNPSHEKILREAMRAEFEWEKPSGCPAVLPLYKLVSADCRSVAALLSCHQEIAGDSCFSLGMIAHFNNAIRDRGPWMYPRLFWESGVLGQLLYLEAHAVGVSATGIGCYFDDSVHEILGLKGKDFQSLYHFTIGVPVVDTRIMSLPAYPGPPVDA